MNTLKALRGSISRNDVEFTDVKLTDWDKLWIDLKTEYWKCLYNSIPHSHFAKKNFAFKLQSAKRILFARNISPYKTK